MPVQKKSLETYCMHLVYEYITLESDILFLNLLIFFFLFLVLLCISLK